MQNFGSRPYPPSGTAPSQQSQYQLKTAKNIQASLFGDGNATSGGIKFKFGTKPDEPTVVSPPETIQQPISKPNPMESPDFAKSFSVNGPFRQSIQESGSRSKTLTSQLIAALTASQSGQTILSEVSPLTRLNSETVPPPINGGLSSTDQSICTQEIKSLNSAQANNLSASMENDVFQDSISPNSTNASYIPPSVPAAVMAKQLRETKTAAVSVGNGIGPTPVSPATFGGENKTEAPVTSNAAYDFHYSQDKLIEMGFMVFLNDLSNPEACKVCAADLPLGHWHFSVRNMSTEWIQRVPEMKEEPRKCGNCQSAASKMCSKCEAVWYCSSNCQTAALSKHQFECGWKPNKFGNSLFGYGPNSDANTFAGLSSTNSYGGQQNGYGYYQGGYQRRQYQPMQQGQYQQNQYQQNQYQQDRNRQPQQRFFNRLRVNEQVRMEADAEENSPSNDNADFNDNFNGNPGFAQAQQTLMNPRPPYYHQHSQYQPRFNRFNNQPYGPRPMQPSSIQPNPRYQLQPMPTTNGTPFMNIPASQQQQSLQDSSKEGPFRKVSKEEKPVPTKTVPEMPQFAPPQEALIQSTQREVSIQSSLSEVSIQSILPVAPIVAEPQLLLPKEPLPSVVLSEEVAPIKEPIVPVAPIEPQKVVFQNEIPSATLPSTSTKDFTSPTLTKLSIESSESTTAPKSSPVSSSSGSETTKFIGTPASNLIRFKLNINQAYKLMPLYLEEVPDRKKVVFYMCHKEYLAEILGKTTKLAKTAPLVDVLKLEVGGVYLVKFDDEWFRGQVLRISDAHFYVDYFDFGNRKYISRKEAEFSFRQMDVSLSASTILPASIRVQVRNVPSFQQYNFLQRLIKESIDSFENINIYVMAYLDESETYQVQLDEP